MQEQLQGNVVSIDKWKQKITEKGERTELEKFSSYLVILSFNELIHESKSHLMDLRKNSLSSDVMTRAQLILKEFRSRIKVESEDHAEAIEQMATLIESKLIEMQELL